MKTTFEVVQGPTHATVRSLVGLSVRRSGWMFVEMKRPLYVSSVMRKGVMPSVIGCLPAAVIRCSSPNFTVELGMPFLLSRRYSPPTTSSYHHGHFWKFKMP